VSIELTWQKSEAVVSCQMDGSEALLNTETGHYYLLNPIGALVWSKLEDHNTIENLVALVLDTYDVSYETCKKDIEGLFASMSAKGLILASEAPV
jgi:hypothetical protein